MKVKIYVPDMECDSCSTLLKKRFEKLEGIGSIKFSSEAVDISFEENKLSTEKLLQTIRDAGYRADIHPFEKKNLAERKREFLEKKVKYEMEYRLLKYSLAIFFILGFLELIAYFLYFKNIPFFVEKYRWWLLYLNISIASLSAALWHFLSYKARVTCMLGMMIGMTMGMQTGLMLGSVFGATNGLFIGSLVGLILGVTAGVLTGKCCGIMGIIQGLMAGLMGGIMGPMTTLMLFSDHLLWFMPLFMAVNLVIVWGFSYMIFEEMVENKEVTKAPISFFKLTLFSIVITAILVMVMVFGIKSPLVGG
ncbi:MAG TPA: heavy metal translocating P-type ATPase [Nanoarchaeota archaeon]|nr:heavy metal translocating P-type ATPase [Candidatus Woesearchaeota archaeon]HIH15316.1 heavy metal translocating P-type ATPase [Nanoarchaeota archaeon]HIH59206.1 heavy metal translocating P-type ATPase [Nanoarchaeota archaeon]HII13479.1 heavy metal translocating P-type ATPase [Nanoarchaeota archaeon]HIJ05568.1 heavy metal translocating P-type ATPase [Nanoarchaeota archaeon]